MQVFWRVLLGLCLLPLCVALRAGMPDVPEWPVLRATDPAMATLDPTGPDLAWNPAEETGNVRQLMSNNPEALGLASDFTSVEKMEASRFPTAKMIGKLWMDEADETGTLKYHLFIWHTNCFREPIRIGIVVENLRRDNGLVITGEHISRLGYSPGGESKDWNAMKDVGKYCSYGDLAQTFWKPIPALTVPAATDTPKETLVYAWKVGERDLLGAHVRLTIRPRQDVTGPLRCRVSTVWAWSDEKLTANLPLMEKHFTQPRGSWRTSELTLVNRDQPFDVGPDERDGRTVRWLRVCQPRFDPETKKKLGYGVDVPYVQAKSYNPEQAYMNNGLYGVRKNLRLRVTNSGQAVATVGLYLRYADQRIDGSYAGAATVFERTADGWRPRDTRAVDLSTMPFRNWTTGEVLGREDWWATKQLAAYPIQPGETCDIPLTLMTNGPSMLPLAVVLKKER